MRSRLFATLAVVIAVGVLGALGTFAAFTATTSNSGNSISSGTVALSDDDAGSAMYQVTGRKPGDVIERCIKVTYDGSLDSTVSMYASAAGAAGAKIDLDITPGTGGTTFPSCSGFTPDASGSIYSGTLKSFTDSFTSYSTGLADNPGAAFRWQQGNSVVYRLRLTMQDDATANAHTSTLATAAHDFTWEARSGGGSYAAAVGATPGLVSFWRLGELSGTTARDSSGANNGTYAGGPTLGAQGALPNDPDKAVSLDGTNDGVAVGNPTNLRLSNGTLEAWIKVPSGSGGIRQIFRKWGAWDLYLSSGRLRTYDWGASTGRDTGVSVDDNNWHHVAMAFQAGVANGTKLYVDGMPVLTTNISTSNQNDGLHIGSTQGGYEFLRGQIDEAAVYNRNLSDSEIKAHFDAR